MRERTPNRTWSLPDSSLWQSQICVGKNKKLYVIKSIAIRGDFKIFPHLATSKNSPHKNLKEKWKDELFYTWRDWETFSRALERFLFQAKSAGGFYGLLIWLPAEDGILFKDSWMKHTHIMFLSRSLGKCHAKDEGAAALVPPKAAIKVLKPFVRTYTRVGGRRNV